MGLWGPELVAYQAAVVQVALQDRQCGFLEVLPQVVRHCGVRQWGAGEKVGEELQLAR